MRLRDIGEFGFIDRIASMASGDPRTVVGIGDDAALLDLGGPELVAVTTDAMLEDRHFRLEWLSAERVGWRAASGALSDLAAMGAAPASVFCTVGLPPEWPVERAEALLRGIADAAESAGGALTGGDVIASERLLVDIMALGLVPPGQQLTRDGARPGQVLAVTGALGGPAAAIAALQALGADALECEELAEIRRRFAHPEPRIAAGRAIAASGLAAAAIDISDGLVQDAGHIARRSGVRAVIEAERVPAVTGCVALARELGCDARRWALAGGEDFELLMALGAGAVEALRKLPAVVEVGLSVVGRVEEGEGVAALDECGESIDLPRGGWDHFA
ncbi:MAG: thiamine-phosphate kinase [Armatimonadota bacterium]|nr:thiamine-phosphate kinase [Armatimonadota bacterium]